jgi:site-specific DNA-methyltransferase (adenine-specific)
MIPHYADGPVTVFLGDCVEVMRGMPDESVHSVVTDPPYGLDFMGKAWDKYTPADFEAWCTSWAVECLRVLKPGGHLLAFGGSRTWHRLAAGIEDAGFEVRDSIAWLYGSGFPKSLDVSKAIDKAAGAEREVVGEQRAGIAPGSGNYIGGPKVKVPRLGDAETAEALTWQGWGTALKPAFEPIVVARKPLAGTVAANVLAHGTGALNIDGARVRAEPGDVAAVIGTKRSGGIMGESKPRESASVPHDAGRWPANVVLDESQAAELDKQSGTLKGGGFPSKRSGDGSGVDRKVFGAFAGQSDLEATRLEDGGASRFFPTFRYEAKAPTSERPRDGDTAHPTVKPLDLMRWLVRLVTPPGGTVLEPFAGSGTTLEAAVLENFTVIGIEREETYMPLILNRLRKPHTQSLFDLGGGE